MAKVWVSGRTLELFESALEGTYQVERFGTAAIYECPDDELPALLDTARTYYLMYQVVEPPELAPAPAESLTAAQLMRQHSQRMAVQRVLNTLEPGRWYEIQELADILLVKQAWNARPVVSAMVERGLLAYRPHKSGPGGYPASYCLPLEGKV